MDEYGTVVFFKNPATHPGESNNFGFVEPDQSGKALYFHASHFAGRDRERVPQKGDRIVFERDEDGPKGPRVKGFDFDPFIPFGDLCHAELKMALKEGALYIGGFRKEIPDLSDKLRFQGNRAMYHSLKIHRDDAPRFVERVKKWQSAKLAGRSVLIYESPTEFFCSNVFRQDGVPEGFELKSLRVPMKVEPFGSLVDGIIANPYQLIQYQYYRHGTLRHIPNPKPQFEPSYSGFFKSSE